MWEKVLPIDNLTIITWHLFVPHFLSPLLSIPHLSLQFLLWNNSNSKSLWSFSQPFYSPLKSAKISSWHPNVTISPQSDKKEGNLGSLNSSELPFLTSWGITKAVFVGFFFYFFVFWRIFPMNMKHSLKARKQILKVFLLHTTPLSR